MTSAIQQISQVASMNQEHTLQPIIAREAHAIHGWEDVTCKKYEF
jgi:hypothetical protein